MIQRLQYVQNSAARLLTGSRKYDHITPILKDFHWLPVKQRIIFKILTLTFKALHDVNSPQYLKNMLQLYNPSRSLRSSSKKLLYVPKFDLKSYDARAFSVCAPVLWNSLSDYIRQSESVDVFKSKLTTFLYK